MTLSHPTRNSVELHFRLSHQALGIPVDGFFERTVSCRLPNGQEVRVLGPADQILHLMLHLAHSRFGTLFNLYELRRVCGAEPSEAQVEAIRMAVDHHYCGVLRMIDLAFRMRWGRPFLTPEVPVRGTWLNWRLNEKLYTKFERASEPGLGMTLITRIRGRWLDFQIIDRCSVRRRSLVEAFRPNGPVSGRERRLGQGQRPHLWPRLFAALMAPGRIEMCWLGIDTGSTGGTRALLIDNAGKEIAAVTAPHEEIRMEHPLWAEQRPEDWNDAAIEAIRGVLAKSGVVGHDIRGIGLSGQMHGLRHPRPITGSIITSLAHLGRPAQPARKVDFINRTIGKKKVLESIANLPPSPASLFPSCSGCMTTNRGTSTVCEKCCSRRTTSASG